MPPCHGAAVRAGGWSTGIMPRPTRPARARSGSEGPSSSVRRRGLTPGAESVVRLPSCVGSRSSPDSAGRIVRRSGVLSCKLLISKRAPVAQLDRASASGADHALADNPEFPGFIGEISGLCGSERVRKQLAERETAGSTAGSGKPSRTADVASSRHFEAVTLDDLLFRPRACGLAQHDGDEPR